MEEKNKEVVEETTQETTEKVEESKKPNVNEDGDYIVDLRKPVENETEKDSADDSGVVAESKDTESTQEQEEVQPETETQEETVLEEITEEETTQDEYEDEELVETETEQQELPSDIQKLIDFMEETGGNLNDYVKLNQDYSELDDKNLLYEYYKQTKPHLNLEEINFLMEDQFSYDEEEDDERDIKRKQLALKEQVANAKAHLDGRKSKYYKEIKAGSKLTKEQQKAINFFDRYNKESEANRKKAKINTDIFAKKTNEVFNDKFKGFEYNVGDKKYRFNINNVDEIKKTQSDLNNFTKKFLDKNLALKDAKGYHKSLYTAMNPDVIAKHFYEQGKTDAIKESVTKSKNVDMNPRQSHKIAESGGIKVRALGDDSSGFKFKIKNKNK